jgi:hypothetical protein
VEVSVCVFVGPTLKSEDVLDFGEMVFLPPVEQGNVYAVSELDPTAIGIIDGRFHDVPAVWHKEILWALHKGVRVYGSASMGALRAAELQPFGMHGNGWVFESYRDGTFEDDDEVAVAHGDQDADYVLISDAMVNIRRTLDAGHEAGTVSAATKDALLSIAKDIYYPLRTFEAMVKRGRQQGLPSDELLELETWLRSNRIDQKKIDALEMLDTMRRDENMAAQDRRTPSFTFQRTEIFDRGNKDARHWTELRRAAFR